MKRYLLIILVIILLAGCSSTPTIECGIQNGQYMGTHHRIDFCSDVTCYDQTMAMLAACHSGHSLYWEELPESELFPWLRRDTQ